jgi:mRNA export factor
VWGVNGFTFNKTYNSFASFGSDGFIVTWNKDNKSKLRSSHDFGQPIICADFSEDGTFLAYATGYDWSKGAEGTKEKLFVNKLFVRTPDIKIEVYKEAK